jgi:adenylate cyclase
MLGAKYASLAKNHKGRMNNPTRDHHWSPQVIRNQVERILGHPDFRATDRMRDFLRFVVDQTLAGNERQLKGFTIATEVFGRGTGFDAAHDPVVRIQAGRLRRALERYYLVAGGNDPIHIDIPKGGYVPVFSVGTLARAKHQSKVSGPDDGREVAWPSIVVLPFRDLTGRDDLSYLAPGLATELSIELAKSGDLRVMLCGGTAAMPDLVSPPRVDFYVMGSIRAEGTAIKVVVQLICATTGEQLWADAVKSDLEEGKLIAFQEQTAVAIGSQIASQHGAIYRAVSDISSGRLNISRGNYAAILKGYAYHLKIDVDSYLLAYEALLKAYARDTGCGLVCTMLATLFVDNFSFEFFDAGHTPIADGLRLAREGVRLEPHVQLSRLVLARAHLLNDDVESARDEMEAAYALHPDSLLFLDMIGYGLALVGEWSRGANLVRHAVDNNPYYRMFSRYGIWLDCLQRGDYKGALVQTEWLDGVGYFWAPLSRAATLGLLGRGDEGRQAVRKLLELKPDFHERGLTLIRHDVKFPEIEQRLVEGLASSGLELSPAHD